MFTLKLYQNGQGLSGARAVIMEVAGIWSDSCDDGVLHVRAFKKTVGVQDEDGEHDFYVGGSPSARWFEPQPPHPDGNVQANFPPVLVSGVGGNYFGWGVLENAQGKTTEMLR